MRGFVARAVERLRSDSGLSRNRFYLALSSPEGKRALRIHRHLYSLERDLASGLFAQVGKEGGRVRLDLKSSRSSRVSYLSRAEFRLLCQSPVVRAAIGEDALKALSV